MSELDEAIAATRDELDAVKAHLAVARGDAIERLAAELSAAQQALTAVEAQVRALEAEVAALRDEEVLKRAQLED